MSGTGDQRLEMAARLREAREYLGLSQDDAATALSISRPAITNIESGSRKVEAVELNQLSKLYQRSVDYFLTGTSEHSESAEGTKFFARNLKDLSPRDLAEVARFASFLRASNNGKTSGKE